MNESAKKTVENCQVEALQARIKELEAQLRTQRQLIESVDRMARIGGWLGDADGTPVWSPGLYRIYGLDPASPPDPELIFKSYEPQAEEHARRTVAEAIAKGEPWDLTLPASIQGRRAWIRTMGYPETCEG